MQIPAPQPYARSKLGRAVPDGYAIQLNTKRKARRPGNLQQNLVHLDSARIRLPDGYHRLIKSREVGTSRGQHQTGVTAKVHAQSGHTGLTGVSYWNTNTFTQSATDAADAIAVTPIRQSRKVIYQPNLDEPRSGNHSPQSSPRAREAQHSRCGTISRIKPDSLRAGVEVPQILNRSSEAL